MSPDGTTEEAQRSSRPVVGTKPVLVTASQASKTLGYLRMSLRDKKLRLIAATKSIVALSLRGAVVLLSLASAAGPF
jgi:hypothetical protein